MNTKKDMIRAAQIVKDAYLTAYARKHIGTDTNGDLIFDVREPVAIEKAFVRFFETDNPNFDEKRFRDACKPKGKGQ